MPGERKIEQSLEALDASAVARVDADPAQHALARDAQHGDHGARYREHADIPVHRIERVALLEMNQVINDLPDQERRYQRVKEGKKQQDGESEIAPAVFGDKEPDGARNVDEAEGIRGAHADQTSAKSAWYSQAGRTAGLTITLRQTP